MIWSILLDAFLIVLLGLTIGYAIVVNRKLDILRTAAADLESLSATLAQSIGQTEDGLGRLKVAAKTTEEEMQRSQRLGDDLRYLLERGDALADRLESAVKAARSNEHRANDHRSNERIVAAAAVPEQAAPRRPRSSLRAAAERPVDRTADVPPRSKAERQLLDMLRASGLAAATAGDTGGLR